MPLPRYFTDFDEPITLPGFEGMKRFTDHLNPPQDSGIELSNMELAARLERDTAYNEWFNRHRVKPKKCKFQRIRLADYYHADNSREDWFREYRDAVLTVFVKPHTEYARYQRQHRQSYILCPEDAYLIQCYERHLKGLAYHPRRSFRWISPHSKLMPLMTLPTETSPHLRHETTGGKLPSNL